ncbi:hypothetical protein GCM10025868_08740 [Angustibacter aerolatus]|uniref:Uncharacterized protein n=1 Tax=Angustibacter aerolatus TaxID=1162965 RepID=A0ABQ6JEQ9_9ACTN|nr:hypothetical protein GCM10025868_08740 [Angustibacter aerolatus]
MADRFTGRRHRLTSVVVRLVPSDQPGDDREDRDDRDDRDVRVGEPAHADAVGGSRDA